jgi:hypothetical protein
LENPAAPCNNIVTGDDRSLNLVTGHDRLIQHCLGRLGDAKALKFYDLFHDFLYSRSVLPGWIRGFCDNAFGGFYDFDPFDDDAHYLSNDALCGQLGRPGLRRHCPYRQSGRGDVSHLGITNNVNRSNILVTDPNDIKLINFRVCRGIEEDSSSPLGCTCQCTSWTIFSAQIPSSSHERRTR